MLTTFLVGGIFIHVFSLVDIFTETLPNLVEDIFFSKGSTSDVLAETLSVFRKRVLTLIPT